MNTKYGYVGISFIILLFGVYVVPKVIAKWDRPTLETFHKVPPFQFVNQHNKTIDNSTYEGKVHVVEFFFATCTTICPLMNTELLALQDVFYAEQNFGIASISITPTIDSPEVLKAYAENHKITAKNWHLLTGKPEKEVYTLANEGFKLYAGKDSTNTDGFEHSGLFALVDKKGYIRSRYDAYGNPIMYYRALSESGFPNQMRELEEDIKILLDE